MTSVKCRKGLKGQITEFLTIRYLVVVCVCVCVWFGVVGSPGSLGRRGGWDGRGVSRDSS